MYKSRFKKEVISSLFICTNAFILVTCQIFDLLSLPPQLDLTLGEYAETVHFTHS